jgi:L-aspartate oxidase
MSRLMAEQHVDHLYLDVRPLGADLLAHRFPTMLANCAEIGVDPTTEPVPVAPAAHYASGGVRTDLHGRTSVSGLYACGEVACTGVHGANRLASNSLLEGLVFATRIGEALAQELPSPGDPVASTRAAGVASAGARPELQRAMTDGAGVLRSADSLQNTAKTLDAVAARTDGSPAPEAWETTNLATVASALVAAAAHRRETRGSHWREDFPDRDDSRWLVRVVQRLGSDGEFAVEEVAV